LKSNPTNACFAKYNYLIKEQVWILELIDVSLNLLDRRFQNLFSQIYAWNVLF
jgi:hypothetical protein